MTSVPIHVRITERWKIDPEYNKEIYHRHTDLSEKYDQVVDAAKPELTVPMRVIEFAKQQKETVDGVPWADIAGALKMPASDFRDLAKYHIKKMGKPKRESNRDRVRRERRQRIYDHIAKHGPLYCAEVSRDLDLSYVTTRKDLQALGDEGRIRLEKNKAVV